MGLDDQPNHVRYGLAMTVLLALGVAASWAITNSGIPDVSILAVPLVLLVIGGITWDGIYLYDHTVRRHSRRFRPNRIANWITR